MNGFRSILMLAAVILVAALSANSSANSPQVDCQPGVLSVEVYNQGYPGYALGLALKELHRRPWSQNGIDVVSAVSNELGLEAETAISLQLANWVQRLVVGLALALVLIVLMWVATCLSSAIAHRRTGLARVAMTVAAAWIVAAVLDASADNGIIVAPVSARILPEVDANVVQNLSVGTLVDVGQANGEYVFVRSANGSGWVQMAGVANIRVDDCAPLPVP